VDYLHGDLIGSIRTTTNAAGEVTADSDYDAYGTPIDHADSPAISEITRFGYAGEYTDRTGHLYLRNRYYDPTTAQFLTLDPALQTTGDPYAYTGGNPLQYTDPLGLDWLDTVGGWLSDESGESLVNNALQSFGAGFLDAGIETLNMLDFFTGGGGNIPTVGNPNRCNSIYDGSYIVGAVTFGAVTAALGSVKAIKLLKGAPPAARTYGAFTRSDLRAAAQVPDRNGLTQVGRALQKHSDREGSVFNGSSTGNAATRNEQGLRVLDEILDDPRGTTEALNRVTNVWDSTGRGVRYSNDGSFMGFLEPIK